MTTINWQWKKFEQLSVYELHDILKLRQEVFIIEQNCVYLDIDDIDKTAWHLLGLKKDSLCAYSRVYQAKNQRQILIGRVLTSLELRGQAIGKQLMQETLEFIKRENPDMPIKVSAQAHLENFYADFGFVKTSEPYDEDGIMHIDMDVA